MYPLDGGARCGWIGAPDGVVEEDDAVASGDVREEEFGYFGVVVGTDGVVRGEGCFGGGGDGEDGLEGIVVEGVGGLGTADVMDEDRVCGIGEVALGEAFRRCVDVVEGDGAVGRGLEEVEVCGYGAAGVLMGDCHCGVLCWGLISDSGDLGGRDDCVKLL